MNHLLELRWRFEYSDGTRPRYGQWTKAATNQNEMAAFQKKTNLARAMIETKDRITKKVSVAVHCKGEDFVRFKWAAIAIAPAFGPVRGEMVLDCQNVGLTIVTRELQATVYIDGSPPRIKRLPENQNFNYAGL